MNMLLKWNFTNIAFYVILLIHLQRALAYLGDVKWGQQHLCC